MDELIKFLQNVDTHVLGEAMISSFFISLLVSGIFLLVWLLGFWLLLPIGVFALSTGMVYVVTVGKLKGKKSS